MRDYECVRACLCVRDTHSGSVSGVVSLGSVGIPPSWLGVRSSSVLTSTMGSLDSSLLEEDDGKKINICQTEYSVITLDIY